MKYNDIKALVERYGEDYLGQGDIESVFNIVKDSPLMQEQLEKGITDEWVELLKTRGKIYVYKDGRKPSALSNDDTQYPYMQCYIQDEKDMTSKEDKTIHTPAIRYVYQIQRQYSRQDIVNDTIHRMSTKNSNEER